MSESDGEYEDVEELVVLRFPALVGAANARLSEAMISLSGMDTAHPVLICDNGLAFEGTWSHGTTCNTAVIGIDKVPAAAAAVSVEQRASSSSSSSLLPDFRLPTQFTGTGDAAAAKAALNEQWAPSLNPRLRPVNAADAAASPPMYVVNGLGTPSRVLTLQLAARPMHAFYCEQQAAAASASASSADAGVTS